MVSMKYQDALFGLIVLQSQGIDSKYRFLRMNLELHCRK